MTGYTHPAYRQMMSNILDAHPLINQWLLIRGMEGSAQLPHDRRCPMISADSNPDDPNFAQPSQFNLDPFEYQSNCIDPKTCIEIGEMGLSNLKSPSAQHLIYQAIMICEAFKLFTRSECQTKCMDSIQSGKALSHWKAALQ